MALLSSDGLQCGRVHANNLIVSDNIMQSQGSAQGSAEGPAPLKLEQRGSAGQLAPIVLLNTLLNIITLSIYRFWGKTRVRRYLWRHTYFLGEPLEYTGTGGELFKGFLAIFFLVLLPLGVISNMASVYLDPEGFAFTAFSVGSTIVIYLLIGMAIYRARRYRLSRTRWRGIRGTMVGSSVQYAFRYVIYWGLTFLSLGWAYPWMRVGLFRRIMSETGFGDRAFRVATSAGPLYRKFAACWFGSVLSTVAVLVIPMVLEPSVYHDFFKGIAQGFSNAADIEASTGILLISAGMVFGVIWFLSLMLWLPWYKAHEFRHLAAGTSFMTMSFRMDATVPNLAGLVCINGLITVFTLGFGRPFAQLRTFRYFCSHLTIVGEVNADWIQQAGAEQPTMGEGLADAFDLGAV